MKKAILIIVLCILLLAIIGFFLLPDSQTKTTSETNQENSQKEGSQIVQEPPTANNEGDTLVEADKGGPGALSPQELAVHNSPTDCWVAYQFKVYDITDYLNKHPGGAGRIIPYCGTAKAFEDAFTGQHGTKNVEVLLKEGTFVREYGD